jgi:hypothetical protein
VARMWERRGPYSVMVGKSEGKGRSGRPRRRRKNNIHIDFQKTFGRTWIRLN